LHLIEVHLRIKAEFSANYKAIDSSRKTLKFLTVRLGRIDADHRNKPERPDIAESEIIPNYRDHGREASAQYLGGACLPYDQIRGTFRQF
jgi:hypothetical protein